MIRDFQMKKRSLDDLLSDLFSTVEEKFYCLVYVDHPGFILKSVWATVAGLLMNGAQSCFAPDQADQFQSNYRCSRLFMTNFVRLFSSVQTDLATAFWKHIATVEFLEKWSLPVYYQVRFLEIGSPLEEAIQGHLSPNAGAAEDDFRLQTSKVLWAAIQRCWHPGVCLTELIHRFWKLTLLLLARYCSWLRSLGLEDDVIVISSVLRDLAILIEKLPDIPRVMVTAFLTDGELSGTVLPVLSGWCNWSALYLSQQLL